MKLPDILIVGIDTEIGKTFIGQTLARALLKRGLDVAVMKPFESGATVSEDGNLLPSDTLLLKRYSESKDEIDLINRYRFRDPVSIYHASLADKVKIDLELVYEDYKELKRRHDIVIIETAGGIFSPVTETFYMADLAKLLDDSPAILVTNSYLGSISKTISSIISGRSRGIDFLALVSNNSDINKEALKFDSDLFSKQHQIEYLGEMPYIKDFDIEKLSELSDRYLSIDKIISKLKEKEQFYSNLESKDKQYIWHPFTQMKSWSADRITIIKSGKGVHLKDILNKDYIDLFSAYWCNLHGYDDYRLNSALINQLGKISHSTFLGLSNIPAIELAEKLVKITPEGLNKVFYSDNGSTAVESALKMAIQYDKKNSKQSRLKKKFVALGLSYHGDTFGSMSVGGIDLYHKIFRDFLSETIFVDSPYCYRCPLSLERSTCSLECADLLEDAVRKNKDSLIALIIEPIVQSPGGIIVHPEGYLKRCKQIVDKYSILMIADEVAVGFGRTGRMFACEHESVSPDIIALSKSITAGYLPFAATVTKDHIYEKFLGSSYQDGTFFHGHTYTANQLGAALSSKNLDLLIQSNFLENINKKSQLLKTLLSEFSSLEIVGEVRMKGMIAAIEIVKDKIGKTRFSSENDVVGKIVKNAKLSGILIRPLGNVIPIFPASVISEDELKRSLSILYDIILTV